MFQEIKLNLNLSDEYVSLNYFLYKEIIII